MEEKKQEENKKRSPLAVFRNAIKEKYRLVAGTLASIAAIGVIGGTAYKIAKDNEVPEVPNDSIEVYDSDYSEKTPTIIEGLEIQEPTKENNESVIMTPHDGELGIEDGTSIKSIQAIGANIFGSGASTITNATINNEPPVEDVSITLNNKPPVEDVSITLNNEPPVEDVFIDVEDTFMEPIVSYSTTELTNEDVVVTITADENVREIEGWDLSEDKKVLTRTYTDNVDEKVIVTDMDGNEREVSIVINNIDKTFVAPRVSYRTLKNGNVKVRISSKEVLQPLKGWKLSKDKKSLIKIYTTNKTEIVTIKDLAGNTRKVLVNVTNILGNTNDNNKPEIVVPPIIDINPINPHIHDIRITTNTVGSADVCAETVEYCVDGDYRKVIGTTAHNLETLVNDDGSIVTSCTNGCGYTNTIQAPTPEHIHKWGDWEITKAATCTEAGEETRTCQDGHVETREITALGHNIETITNADGTITETCLNGCGYTNTIGTPKPVDPIEIDMSSLSIDIDTFEYDGKMHLPEISGLPEGVTARFVFEDKDGNKLESVTNAGEYVCRIEFDTPEGYTAKPVEIDYRIKPATISCSYEYDEKTGELNALYKGVIEGDVEEISHKVNGEELTDGTKTLDEFGVYKVESSIEISPDKTSNYVFADDLSEKSIYQVKRDKTWIGIDTVAKEEDGKIIIEVYLSNDKMPHCEGLVMPNVSLNIYFDRNQLEYNGDDCENTEGLYKRIEGGWEQYVNSEFKHTVDPDADVPTYDATFGPYIDDELDEDGNLIYDSYEYWDGLPDRVKVGQLTFTIKEGHENDKDIVIILDDAFFGIESDIPLAYTTDASVCVINPSKEEGVTTITLENDLLDDAIYVDVNFDENDPDDVAELQEYKDALQDYIDNGYQFSDEEEYETEIGGDESVEDGYELGIKNIDEDDVIEQTEPQFSTDQEEGYTLSLRLY